MFRLSRLCYVSFRRVLPRISAAITLFLSTAALARGVRRGAARSRAATSVSCHASILSASDTAAEASCWRLAAAERSLASASRLAALCRVASAGC